jgi:hypothetical protein
MRDLAAAGAKLLDAANPFTTSDEDLAVLYKNDPEGLKHQREQGATAILSRFARNQTKQADEIMQGIPQQTKDSYGAMKYQTLDPDKAAYLHPVKVVSDAIRSMPTTMALALTAFLTKGASTKAYTSAIESGLSEEAARKAAIDAATHLASRFGAGSEGAIGYAQQYNSTQQQVEALPFATLEKSPEFQKLVASGFDPNAARIFLSAKAGEQSGVGAGLVDAATSGIGGHYLGKILGEGGNVLPRIGKGFANEAITETVQSGGEQFSENLAIQQNANPEQSLSANVVEGMLQGFAVGGLTGGAVSGLVGRVGKEEKKLAETDKAAQTIGDINTLSTDSKVRPRSTEVFRDFIKGAKEEGPVNQVYIDAGALMQSGVADQVAELSPSVAEQLKVAQETGVTTMNIAIPVEEYAAAIAPTEYAQSLFEHLKTDPEGFTVAEKKEAMQGDRLDELGKEFEKAVEQDNKDSEFQQSSERLRKMLLDQHNALGHFQNDTNKQYAALWSHRFDTLAEAQGITPEEAYKNYVSKYSSEFQQGYDQAKPFDLTKLAETEGFKTGQPVSFDFSHTTESATALFGKPKKGDQFQRDLEPSGRYVVQVPDATKVDTTNGRESGQLTFNNPLVLNAETWKKDLAAHYKKTGKRLSQALIADGYDGVVTVDKYGTSEILDLTTFDESKALYQSARDLMVTHNLSERNLLHVQKMGGIPVPSLAVTKKETPLNGFGEITLMGSPEMADPKGYAKTQVFGADIYSPRYPGVEYQVAPKVMQEAKKTLKPAEEATGARFDWDDLERNGPKYLDRSAPLMWMFLREKGIEPITVKDSVEPLPPALAAYADFQGFKHELVKDPEFQKAAENWWLDRLIIRYDGDLSLAQEEIAMQKANAIANDLDAPGFVHSAATRVTDYQHLKRRAETSGGVDRYETQRAMASQIEGADLNTEMEEFAQGFVASLNPKEKIFQGFTNSGNRRYVDHTLENVVKILKKELRGGEGFNYGIGSLRAKFTPQFKTIAQIQKNKDRLMSSADFEKVKEEIDTELSELSEVLGLSEDQTIGVMEDLPKMGLQKAVQYYDPNFQPTDEQRQATGEFLTRLQNLPTAYFEAKILRDVDLAEFNGAVVPSSISQKALDALKARGITDIKTYEAGNEQDRSAKIAEFEHLFFQKQNDKARGSFNPDTLTISLLKGADLSTFLHETGHYFLEMQFDLAAKLQGEADIFGYDSLKPGERTIVADTQKILDWFGVPDLQTWYNMSLDEKRPHHEQFARGFEAYLFEGNAPSIELQAVFQKFRDWLVRVYKSLKNLNVELTDEVRGVFDRMLASEEQIALAEQARSMMPLFTTIDQAPMSPDEFRDYQEQGKAATAAAVGDLESRGLRDMQWLRNARSKALKALQKEAKEKRREVQMDVRAEVMAQPIYRAWTLLTSKINPEDKLPVNTPPKSNPDFVDPSIDSLFAAIGKLGGVDKEELFSTWGIDPAYKPHSGVFGKPVWRKDGGRTIDGMLEALAEHGYLPKDQHGKADTRDFEEAFDRELRGDKQYSVEHDYAHLIENRAGDQVANPGALAAVRFDLGELLAADYPKEIIELLKARKMVANNGLHPDIVAGLIEDEQGNPSFSSGDALVRGLAEAEPPKEAIENLTDVRMLEKYGDIATPDALEKAADRAIHNDVRARVVATEANALAKATGQRKVLAKAAKALAEMTISRQKVRNVTPGQYTNAEARAAKSAEKYLRAKDLVNAAAEKRNQLFNLYAARAAMDAKDSIEKGLRYLKKFNGDIKGIDADYADQIAAILNRFDLRKITNKEVERRISLAKWLDAQRDAGFEPDIPEGIKDEAFLKSYKELTVEEFRGLVDSVKQIEHLGRLKKELLTAKDRREFEAVRDEITASIEEHAQDRTADTRTPTTNLGRSLKSMKAFAWAHAKVGTLARILDGGKDGGPVWEYLIRPANERGDWETTMRAEATKALSEIMAPVFALGKMGGSGKLFPTVGRSFNRESVLAIALNSGNQGNLQRLLGGEGWTVQQIMPILQSLTADEWRAVQAIWDHFESYRPEIAAKERRVYGKEPNWVEPAPFTIKTADGQEVNLRGGYYPIKYDPAASQRAEEHNDAEAAKRQLQGAYTSATTRRSFTKSRVEEVNGRPLLYTLSGMYSGVNDVIHDLAWHEWLIDANRLLRARSIDASIRSHYGPEVKQQFKDWSAAIAEGEKGLDHAGEIALAWLRQGISAAGLGFNLMSALMQLTGITQSVSRVGAKWIGLGVNAYVSHPIETAREVNELSAFMQNRARTRFRELNELRNQVQDQSKFKEFLGQYAYFLMMRCQQAVDVPTWWGAYQKAQAEGFDDERAIALADQAVIDAQGSGMTKDMSAIERSPALKLFTVFYSFMNTSLNLGIDKTMSAEIGKRKAKLAAEYVLLFVIPVVLNRAIKDALTPNGDDDDDYFEKLPGRLIADEIDYLMGLMVVLREFSEAAKLVTGSEDHKQDYQGPAGLRFIADAIKLSYQVGQGDFDTAFRKSFVNLMGDGFGLPAAQINRTWTGVEALSEGKTDNPAAIAFGFKEQR